MTPPTPRRRRAVFLLVTSLLVALPTSTVAAAPGTPGGSGVSAAASAPGIIATPQVTRRADRTRAVLRHPTTSVTVRERAGLTARIEPGSRRPVLLQERGDDGWTTVERVRTGRDEAPATLRWAPRAEGLHRLRVVAPQPPKRPGLGRLVSSVERVYGSLPGAPGARSARSSLPVARAGAPYAVPLTVFGDRADLRWSLVRGELPAGITLDATTGVLLGAALSTEPDREVTFRVLDDAGRAAWVVHSLRTRATTAPGIDSRLAPATLGQEYVDAATLVEPRVGSWSIERGALPPGLELDPDTGVVAGVPTAVGDVALRLRFTEVTGRVAAVDDRLVVVDDGGTDWSGLVSAGGVTCGTQVDASGWCWGRNDVGQVGDGSRVPRLHPARLPGPWAALDTNGLTTCGVSPDGVGSCWGDNTAGAVGDGSGRPVRAEPRLLPGTWQQIDVHDLDASSGSSVCGLRTDDSLWCWGWDLFAASGDGSGGRTPDGRDDQQPVPYRVPGRWQDLPVGVGQTRCAIDLDDRAWCWGANQSGQVGNGETGDFRAGAAPDRLPGSWTSVVTSAQAPYAGTTCGVRTDATGWCWGHNQDGAVGDDTREDSARPVQVPGAWAEITPPQSPGAPTCGLRPDATAACWGRNDTGGVGDATSEDRLAPVDLPGAWRSLASAGQTTCGVTTDGSGWCWGDDSAGAVGDGPRRDVPAPPHRLEGQWSVIAPNAVLGAATSCGIRTDATAWCWGQAADGRTGTGPLGPDGSGGHDTTRAAPVQLPGTWRVITQAPETATRCGITLDGTGACWGENSLGAVGDGTLLDRFTPYVVVGGVDTQR